jgi:hypothetical protein
MKICSHESCERKLYARKLCKTHYNHLISSGVVKDIRKQGGLRADEKIRMLVNTAPDMDECMTEGVGYKQDNGYRQVYYKGKPRKVHRISAEMYLDSYNEDEPVHHICSNRACFNPNHLQMISQRENIAEMKERNYYIKRIASLEARIAELESRVR